MIKRLLKKALLFALPFVLALAMFFAVEPYDYLGLHGGRYPYGTMPVSAAREAWRAGGTKNFIFGDSRLANLDVDYVEQLSGERYTMLAFGGSNPGECFELFWWAAENFEMEKVVFQVSFYKMNGEQTEGRAPTIIEQAQNPLKFMFNYDYWLKAIAAGKDRLLASLRGENWLEDYAKYEDPRKWMPDVNPAIGEKYRKDLEDYAATAIYPSAENYEILPETYAQFDAVIDYCEQNGIELTFVFPPCSRVLFYNVAEPLGIMPEYERFKNHLIARADVFDMEFLNEFTETDANFFDGLHLTVPNKKLLAEWIFTTVDSDYIIRHYKGGGA